MRLCEFLAKRVRDGAWNVRLEIYFVKSVAVALEELDRASAQAKYLIAIGRLKYAQQRLGVKAVRRNS